MSRYAEYQNLSFYTANVLNKLAGIGEKIFPEQLEIHVTDFEIVAEFEVQ
jgi:hypothetical protein